MTHAYEPLDAAMADLLALMERRAADLDRAADTIRAALRRRGG